MEKGKEREERCKEGRREGERSWVKEYSWKMVGLKEFWNILNLRFKEDY